MAPITRSASSTQKMKVLLTEISAHCCIISVVINLIMLLQQLRSGKRSKQRYGLLGGARPLGGSKKKGQRKAAGFQKKQPEKSESQKRQERRERWRSALFHQICLTAVVCVAGHVQIQNDMQKWRNQMQNISILIDKEGTNCAPKWQCWLYLLVETRIQKRPMPSGEQRDRGMLYENRSHVPLVTSLLSYLCVSVFQTSE